MRQGEIIADKYMLQREIGRGGVGVVFAAQHLTLQRAVALKFLRPEVAREPETIARFLREARAAAQLRSEHVARVMDAGALDGGAAYLVMELLEGRDLQAVSTEEGPLPIGVAVDYVMQACEGVAEAHALGIIHRDLKPANLFLTRGADGTPLVKVLDFGLSKIESSQPYTTLTADHHVFGSPHFMSPEQMRSSRDADARSDIWSLGVVLYSLLAGRVPFDGVNLPEVCSAVLLGGAPRLSSIRADVPAGLAEVVERCLRQEREDRYQSVSGLASALAPFNAEAGAARATTIDASFSTPPAPKLRSGERTRVYVALAALAGVAAAVVTILLVHRPPSVASPAPSLPVATIAEATQPEPPVESPPEAPRSVAPPVAGPVHRAPGGAGGRAKAPPPHHPAPKSEEDVILQLPH